jgi:hypothetical protein
MTQFTNNGSNILNPNMARKKASINNHGNQLNFNHRICQSGDKITINSKKKMGN